MHKDGADPSDLKSALLDLNWITESQAKSALKKSGALCFAKILIQEKVITLEQLRLARKHQRKNGAKSIDVECALCEVRIGVSRVGCDLSDLNSMIGIAIMKGKTR